ncbi:MOB kinase activator-like 2 [Orchesella cincta]|uniref:MOB kinase activator-like 2 n=1 Tax=Orchesella cincta TaxID=48709 RepID=A0A1D2MQB7_ORCCI|nr:MOB kinase activator-like 2 [Orchesella cincta]
MDKLPEYLRDTVEWFLGKTRRRRESASASLLEPEAHEVHHDERKLYLESALLETLVSLADLEPLVKKPIGMNENEWMATQIIPLFENVNEICCTVSEFCTSSSCPDMNGPGMRLHPWYHEKGKKAKVSAPQYIDYVMTFIQNTIHDETMFPTKAANLFPSSFAIIVKKICELLFHVIAHLYENHFKE